MSLRVRLPKGCERERAYAAHVVFHTHLGINVSTVFENRSDVVIDEVVGDGRVVLADVFFPVAHRGWLDSGTIPRVPLDRWQPAAEMLASGPPIPEVPILFGRRRDNGDLLRIRPGAVELGIDVLGCTFFLLTRYEEAAKPLLDRFGRFPSSESLSTKAGFLDRPLADEYIEILWRCLNRVWPRLVRPARSPRLFLTHDVDFPCCIYGVPRLVPFRQAVGDLVHRRDPLSAWRRVASAYGRRPQGPDLDPCHRFSFLMDLSERHGHRSSFNFLVTDGSADCYYTLKDPVIRNLFDQIVRRGHEIGYHASSAAARNPGLVAREVEALNAAAAAAGSTQKEWGGRYHYLRWRALDSWATWDSAGAAYDSSVGFAERAGFRAGCCHEFPTYDLSSRRPLSLRERPLIAMDTTLLSRRYEGVASKDVERRLASIAQQVKRFDGDFVLLWHNDTLIRPGQVELLRRVVESIMECL